MVEEDRRFERFSPSTTTPNCSRAISERSVSSVFKSATCTESHVDADSPTSSAVAVTTMRAPRIALKLRPASIGGMEKPRQLAVGLPNVRG